MPAAALVNSSICNRELLEDWPSWRGRLKNYFMRRVRGIAYRLDLQLQLWEDGPMGDDGVAVPLGGSKENIAVNVWNNVRRSHAAFSYANEGYRVSMSCFYAFLIGRSSCRPVVGTAHAH